ncbi:MAG: reverse transcriptase domain-containing protein [Christensenella sp.]|nr:reverse transcriptase domain-containing protein [Christensenella sp.]
MKALIWKKNESIIDGFICCEAAKLAKRHDGYHNYTYQESERKRKRFLQTERKYIKQPEWWALDSKFNPYYVLKHHKQISRSIKKKLLDGSYMPNPPYIKKTTTRNGKKRILTIYQVPDAAVSNYLYYKLLSKNKHRMSHYAYAYRDDKNVHFAIQDISIDLKELDRVFVAEYDFSDFFGSISHEYLFEQMNKNGYIITQKERSLIKKFLPSDGVGIRLGTSISLFLANLVCWQLDRNLELEGLRFARYADDTIIWSRDYSKICAAHKIIRDFSEMSKVKINQLKSGGISLLTCSDTSSELAKTKTYIEFLGYKISTDKTSIREKSCLRIKETISYILHQNLIQPLHETLLNANELSLPKGNYDPALVVAISQIRRYLYGDLTDEKIIKYLNNTYKKLEFKGLMSFYPLVNDEEQLKALDGWLAHTVLTFLKRRNKILEDNSREVAEIPTRNYKLFLEYCSNLVVRGTIGACKIPSFVRIYKAIQKGINTYGLDSVINPQSLKYDYED